MSNVHCLIVCQFGRSLFIMYIALSTSLCLEAFKAYGLAAWFVVVCMPGVLFLLQFETVSPELVLQIVMWTPQSQFNALSTIQIG